MGGRLRAFAHRWRVFTGDKLVRSVTSAGFSVRLNPFPPGFSLRRRTRLPRDPHQARDLRSEIDSLLTKRAIIPVPDSPSLLLSSVFLTPKRTGGYRMILNLKPLNTLIDAPRFRMESLSAILPQLSPSDWAISLDLKDAYLHVPIADSSIPLLGFHVDGRTYCYRALPFGIKTAPWIFTRIVRAVAAELRKKGLRLFCYLDDWLLVAQSRTVLLHHRDLLLRVITDLGFLINWEKSALEPTQRPIFLGAVLDLPQTRARPADHRIESLITLIRSLLRLPLARAKVWLRLLGLMASLVDLVVDCRFHMRVTQMHVLRHYRPTRDSLRKRIPMSGEVRRSLRWWSRPALLLAGKPFQRPPPTEIISTDASLLGWGAHLGEHRLHGTWRRSQSLLHINKLELLAVTLALKGFLHLIAGKSVLVKSDNATVVAYINHQGGTRSRSLCRQTLHLFRWTRRHRIHLRAAFIPGKENTLADFLSRNRQSPTEWQLKPSVAARLFRLYDTPQIDLFASILNAQLPVFCTRYREPQAWATDAFSITWTGFLAYAFPPFPLLPRVLEKINHDGANVLLLAPFWPRRPWFPLLADLLAGTPTRLLPRHDLLNQPDSHIHHPHTESLHLVLWPLSGCSRTRQAFRTGLPTCSPSLSGTLPDKLMIPDFDHTSHGATIYRLIRFRVL